VPNFLDSGVRLAAHCATLDGPVGAVVPISLIIVVFHCGRGCAMHHVLENKLA